jgi:hypothetical protein
MTCQPQAKAAPEPCESAAIDFYQARDRMMRAYNPSTEEERLLVGQIAHAWLRLQRFYELESKVLAETDLFDLFTKHVGKYKLLTRGVADAERMWRHAVEMFERARRRTTPSHKSSSSRGVSFGSRGDLSPLNRDAQASTAASELESPHRPQPHSRPLALV